MQPVMMAIIRIEIAICDVKTKINIKEHISPKIHMIADAFTSFLTDLYKREAANKLIIVNTGRIAVLKMEMDVPK